MSVIVKKKSETCFVGDATPYVNILKYYDNCHVTSNIMKIRTRYASI